MTKVKTEAYDDLKAAVRELRLLQRVAAKYRNTQNAPLWAAGAEVVAELARGGVIETYNGHHDYIYEAPGVKTYLQHHFGEDGLLDGTAFVVLHEPTGRAAVVREHNCEYETPSWVNATTVEGDLVEYERSLR